MSPDQTHQMKLRILYNQFSFDLKTPCTLTSSKMVNPFDPRGFNSSEKIDVFSYFCLA